ncbi:MAG: ABC transporter permease [Alicyclobacillaceae bacterium]|jgi:ABC-type transport system involved in multi-copper enzyme maturation permease subunit|uniref:ABC transporter permease n=1 Tax=Alicyclobacillus sp. SP_1 TaxID=2942475 RepID=UPI002157261C|nr:ABC transporter permease [Alicyclobacillus sp. SP_1]MCY0888418.1 ABC transporter permease [Alicyclobacillaceae bacterium]MCY0895485.1 ABC transporter permease [Alicyclobacillaceae bacterium]
MMRNPILLKEFRQRMRTVRAPMVVTGYVASMAVLTFLLLYENVQGQLYLIQPSRSEQVFFVLSLLQMLVVAFLTPAFSAGSMSGERERRTLAVLLTTPLSPFSILFGKVLASSALQCLLLMASLPLYSLVFLFGGAVPQEVVAVLLFQLFTIFIVATISVMWSTIALRSGWSTVLSYATVSFMILVTGTVGLGLQSLAKNPVDGFAASWGHTLLSLNPLWVEAALENAVHGGTLPWVTFALFYVIIALILTPFCLWRLRPQWLRRIPGATRMNERNYQ